MLGCTVFTVSKSEPFHPHFFRGISHVERNSSLPLLEFSMLLSHLPLLGSTFQRPHVTSVKPGSQRLQNFKRFQNLIMKVKQLTSVYIYLNIESLVVLPQTHSKLKFVNANLSEWFFSNFMALLEYINCSSKLKVDLKFTK